MENGRTAVKSTVWEKIIMGVGNIGSNLCWSYMAGFITLYYTNSVGLAAASVGTMMLIARLLDGISDVVFGVIIEKAHFKMGKIRPWFIISGPLCGIGLWLCFHVPQSLSEGGKLMFSFVTYSFVAAIAYTIFNLAYAGIIPLMSYDENDRNKISLVQMVFVYIGITVMYMVTPIAITQWGGYDSQSAWGKLTTIFAILCTVLCTLIGVVVKEKQPQEEFAAAAGPETPERTADGGKLSTGAMLKILFGSKYTWILVVLFIAYYIVNGTSGIMSYYWTYVFNNFELSGLATTISMPVTLAGFLVLPILLRKFSKEKVITWGLVLITAARILGYVFSRNMIAFIIFNTVATFGLVPLMSLSFTLSADLIDYFVRVKGHHLEGLASAAFSIGVKIGTGLGSALVGWGLAIAGFDAAAAEQAASVEPGIIFIYWGIPLIAAVIMLVCIRMWDIREVIARAESDAA